MGDCCCSTALLGHHSRFITRRIMPRSPQKLASKRLRRLKDSWDQHNKMNCPLVDIVSLSNTTSSSTIANYDDGSSSTENQKEKCNITKQQRVRIEQYRESDLVLTKVLGRGGFCKVSKAHHRNYPNNFFAIKELKTSVRSNRKLLPKCASDLVTETALLATLSNQENIITLLGIRRSEESSTILDQLKVGEFFLCLELLHETLSDKLKRWRGEAIQQRRFRQNMMNLTTNTKKRRMQMNNDVLQRLEDVAMGIVKGMEYLHENNIIYR